MLRILFVCLLSAGALAAQWDVIERSTVYKHQLDNPYDPANLFGFNHAPNVIVLPDGRLFAVWFSGPFEASVHQSVIGSYSADQGRTWTRPEVMSDFPRRSDFDPALLSDGKRVWLFFSAGRWNRYPFVSDEKNNVGENSFQIYVRTTDDSGRTWTPPVPAAIGRSYNCRNNGIRLTTGELILPIVKIRGGESGVLKSADGGKTWNHYGKITSPQGEDEPTIVELKSGAILMYLRTGGGTLWRTVSRDKGETWSTPENTQIVAARSSHSLFRLKDGRIVLTHNASPSARTPLTMRISSDDGTTWGQPLILASVPEWRPGGSDIRRQVSYPTVAQLADGTLVVLWADIGIADTVQYGDIQCARVRVP
ncbi:MAG: exo-alpha-sialidase [Bryobacteraceae bacterium]